MLPTEQNYRANWTPASTLSIPKLLVQHPEADRDDLLIRLILIDMELGISRSSRPTLHATPDPRTIITDEDDEDDDRVAPRLELYLLRFPQLRDRWELLSQLIVFEFTLLSKGSQYRPISHYCDLFPEHTDAIIGLLKRIESSLQRHASTFYNDKSRPNPGDTTIAGRTEAKGGAWTLPHILGRYYLLSFVDSGGMGNVFRALDMRRGTLVAIKVIRNDDAWSIYQFNQEFRTLAQVRHRHLIRLFDAFSEDGIRYFSMELITGSNIGRWATENRQTTDFFDRLRYFTRQLISVLHHLHQQKIVHRDIKPSNVLLRSPKDVVLLDCSLAQNWSNPKTTLQPFDNGEVVGTLCYMPPEIIAKQRATPASDWYSLGVTLFELITGEFPKFGEKDDRSDSDSIGEQLLRLAPNCPEDLKLLCQSLLHTTPTLRPSGIAIAQAMGVPLDPSNDLLSAPIGRGPILASLNEFLAADNSKQMILLYGDPGIGTTAVLDHCCGSLIQDHGLLQIRICCFKQDQTPYRTIHQLTHYLADQLRLQEKELWHDLLPVHALSLQPHFPELVDLCSKNEEASDVVYSFEETLSLVASLLTQLSQRKSLLLAIDNLQWSDEQSRSFILNSILTPQFRGKIISTWSIATRSLGSNLQIDKPPDEIAFAQSVTSMQPLAIARLPAGDMKRLLFELFGNFQTWTDKQLSDILSASNGNPGRMQHIAHYVISSSINLELTEGDEHLSTNQRLKFLRMEPISKTARKFTQFLACSLEPLKLITLERLLKVSPDELLAAQEELERTRWIVTNESAEGLDVCLSDDALRPIILDTMPAARIQRRHQRLAQCLISLHDSPWMQIGYHYEASGRLNRAKSAYKESLHRARHQEEAEAASRAIERLEKNLST
ncbi:MAG: Serine/threonine-protein kinase PrkC [Planctomycetota bacterium]|jgi:serine/threonine protein kinase